MLPTRVEGHCQTCGWPQLTCICTAPPMNAHPEVLRLSRENDELRAIVELVVYFGEALIQREYAPGSPTVKELVERARKVMEAHTNER